MSTWWRKSVDHAPGMDPEQLAGGVGIRIHGRAASTPDLDSGPFDRSGILPRANLSAELAEGNSVWMRIADSERQSAHNWGLIGLRIPRNSVTLSTDSEHLVHAPLPTVGTVSMLMNILSGCPGRGSTTHRKQWPIVSVLYG